MKPINDLNTPEDSFETLFKTAKSIEPNPNTLEQLKQSWNTNNTPVLQPFITPIRIAAVLAIAVLGLVWLPFVNTEAHPEKQNPVTAINANESPTDILSWYQDLGQSETEYPLEDWMNYITQQQ
jgi:hypothetical protein